jgi:hypothetical protein
MASSNAAPTSRTGSPRTNGSSALVRVTPIPNSRGAKGSSVPRSFGRSTMIGPAEVLTVTGAHPLRSPYKLSLAYAPAEVVVGADTKGCAAGSVEAKPKPDARAISMDDLARLC